MSPVPDTRLMVGTDTAATIHGATRRRAEQYVAAFGRRPCLAAVLVGDDPASVTYVRMKRRRCREAGIDSRLVSLAGTSTTTQVVEAVGALSEQPEVDGILLQHPLPAGVDERAAFEAIAPAKDVDGVTTQSLGAMALGRAGLVSATPGGILRLLDAYEVDLAGKRAVVVGRSPILGKPVGLLLLGRDATVTFCHSKTKHRQRRRRGLRARSGQGGTHHPRARRGGADDHRGVAGTDRHRRLGPDRIGPATRVTPVHTCWGAHGAARLRLRGSPAHRHAVSP